jgi:hypothetical protein
VKCLVLGVALPRSAILIDIGGKGGGEGEGGGGLGGEAIPGIDEGGEVFLTVEIGHGRGVCEWSSNEDVDDEVR